MTISLPTLPPPTASSDAWLIIHSDERGELIHSWEGGSVCRLDGEALRDGAYGAPVDGVLKIGPFKLKLVAYDWGADNYHAERVG